MKITWMALGLVLLLGWTEPAYADTEGFVSPFIGYNFGGDSGCPHINNCEDKRLNAGVSVGALGPLFGFEEEFAYAKNFFGSAPGLDSSVLTVMSNLALVPHLGPFRPYVLAGVGLVKTHVSFTTTSIFTRDNNHLGWDAGGGLMIFFGPHVGLRGDVRYFHSFQEDDLDALGIQLANVKLDFGRVSGALVFKF